MFDREIAPSAESQDALTIGYVLAGGRARILFSGFAALYLAAAAPSASEAADPGTILASLFLASALVILSVIDVQVQRLPDILTLPLLATGVLVHLRYGVEEAAWSLAAAAVAFIMLFGLAVCYRHLRGREGLGLGDAKLFAASGAWVGIAGLPSALLLASGSAIAAILAGYLLGAEVKNWTRIPFGPFLSLGTWIVWLYGSLF